MANLLFTDFTITDGATVLDSSGAVAAFPVSNLHVSLPSDVWRAPDLTAQYIEWDLGAAETINVISLLYTNLEESTTWRIRAATSQANLTAAPGYDSGTIGMKEVDYLTFPRSHSYQYESAGKNYRYWRIDVGAQGTNQFQAGRVLFGAQVATTYTTASWSVQLADDSEIIRVESGGSYALSGGKYRIVNFAYNYLTFAETHGDGLFDIDRAAGRQGDVMVVRDPADDSYIMHDLIYGRLEPGPAQVAGRIGGSLIYTKSYQVIEAELP